MAFHQLSARIDSKSLRNLEEIARHMRRGKRNRSVALRFILRRSKPKDFDFG